MLIDKREITEVAVESMNKTHFDEIEMVNRLYVLITQSLSGQAVDQQLAEAVDELFAHVEQHFKSEEILMTDTGFPAFSVHKGEHDRVRLELAAVLEPWKTAQNIQPLADYLKNVHPAWAKNHIATMDTMTAYFIMQAKASSRVG